MKTLEKEQKHETLEEENKEFHDAQVGKEKNKTQELEWSKTQQKRQTRRFHRLGMRLQNPQNKTTKVQIVQVNETRNLTIEEDDLQERENFTGKNEFLSWVGAHDCVKDKLTGYYNIQLMGINAKEKNLTQPKLNHYKYMKQKVKPIDINNKNDIFKDCQAEWDKEEDTKKI